MTKNYLIPSGLKGRLYISDIEYLETHGNLPKERLGQGKTLKLYSKWFKNRDEYTIKKELTSENNNFVQEPIKKIQHSIPFLLTSKEYQRSLFNVLKQEKLFQGAIKTIAHQNSDGSFNINNKDYSLNPKTIGTILNNNYVPLTINYQTNPPSLQAIKVELKDGQLEGLLKWYSGDELNLMACQITHEEYKIPLNYYSKKKQENKETKTNEEPRKLGIGRDIVLESEEGDFFPDNDYVTLYNGEKGIEVEKGIIVPVKGTSTMEKKDKTIKQKPVTRKLGVREKAKFTIGKTTSVSNPNGEINEGDKIKYKPDPKINIKSTDIIHDPWKGISKNS